MKVIYLLWSRTAWKGNFTGFKKFFKCIIIIIIRLNNNLLIITRLVHHVVLLTIMIIVMLVIIKQESLNLCQGVPQWIQTWTNRQTCFIAFEVKRTHFTTTFPCDILNYLPFQCAQRISCFLGNDAQYVFWFTCFAYLQPYGQNCHTMQHFRVP